MNFDNLDAIARKLMLNRQSHNAREPGHGDYHCNRVMRGVFELRCTQTDDASHVELLRAAALAFALPRRWVRIVAAAPIIRKR